MGVNGKEPTCQYRRHKRCEFDLWVRKIIISRGIFHDQFTILNEVALANLVDLLVDLSAVIVSFLPSPSHREGHPGSMLCPNTGTPCTTLIGSYGAAS